MGHSYITAFYNLWAKPFLWWRAKIRKSLKLCFKPAKSGDLLYRQPTSMSDLKRPGTLVVSLLLQTHLHHSLSCSVPQGDWPACTTSVGYLVFWVLGGFPRQGALAEVGGGGEVNNDGVFIPPTPFLKFTQYELHLWGHRWEILSMKLLTFSVVQYLTFQT